MVALPTFLLELFEEELQAMFNWFGHDGCGPSRIRIRCHKDTNIDHGSR